MKNELYVILMEQDLETIMHVFCEEFGLENRGKGNTLKMRNGSLEAFAVVATRTVDELKDFVARELHAVKARFHAVQTPLTDIKLNVLHQVTISGAVVNIEYSDPDSDTIQPPIELLHVLADILHRLDGLLLIEKATLLLDKELNIVLSDQGKSEVDSFFPAERPLPPDFFHGAPTASVERRHRSMQWLRQQGIYVVAHLPRIESEEIAKIRSVEAIALRAAALLAVALHAEVLMTENMDVKQARSYSNDITDCYGCEAAFSPKEKEFLINDAPEELTAIHFSWQYECLYVMLWALGYIDSLSFPEQICDVAATVRIIHQYNSLSALVAAAVPRTLSEVLDAADLIYRLDWSCVNARISQLPMPRNLDGGVVQERHKSLNWLIDSDGVDWDDVDVST